MTDLGLSSHGGATALQHELCSLPHDIASHAPDEQVSQCLHAGLHSMQA